MPCRTIITAFLLFTLALAAIRYVLPPRAAAAAPRTSATTLMSITAVSRLDPWTNEWTVTLSSGTTLRVENRVFDVGGTSPRVGPIADFHDQGWLPILGYYGYATFSQNNLHYHAKH